jgi:hypothetical protein
MKLYEPLPDSVKVNGRRVKIDLEFRNVLRMVEILADDGLMPDAREWLAMKCICRRPRKGMYPEVRKMLFPEREEYRERITDLDQDADMIRAAFRQAYGIDLFRAKLHWQEFTELLNNLPDGTRYANIIDIRAKPLPEATKWNGKQRQALIEAKMKFALDKTEDELKKSYKQGVSMLANALLMMAKGGGDDG